MRRRLVATAAFILAAELAPGLAWAADPAAARLQYPLAPSTISVRKGTLAFKAWWTGPLGSTFNPRTVDSTIALRGGASDGATSLLPEKWKVLKKGRGYRYVDRKGAAGGIRSILVRLTHNGGRVKISGRGPAFQAMSADQVGLTLTIGTASWCAEFTGPFQHKAAGLTASSDTAPASCPCAAVPAGTWRAIQSGIIERNGCTAAACHGSSPGTGNLDLRPSVAFQNLVGVPSTIDPSRERVKRADRAHSIFWLKLAKATLGGEYANVPGSGMPFTGQPISKDELEAVRLWIQAGAPETGVVAGTEALLATCLGPPDPIKITPPAVPAAADGVQFYAPPWTIPPHNADGKNGENEICQATHFDVSDSIPDSVKLSRDDPRCRFWSARCSDNPAKHCQADTDCTAPATCQSGDDCFFLNRTELTQDPNSHHSIIHIYRGQYAPGSPEYTSGFGPFTCRTGDKAGQPCDPTGPQDQCPGSVCAGKVQSSVACVFYGPADYGFDVTGVGADNSPNIGGSQQPYDDNHYPAGVYGVYPVKGTIVWNSHAFNVTDAPTTNEQWFNVFFAKTDADRQDIVRGIFDSRYIFTQDVPAFEKREYCATFTLPQGARVSELSSHTHKRGVLFRIWLPPNASCTPCQTMPPGFSGCRTTNPNCVPNAAPPLVSTTTYNDPAHYVFETPMALDAADTASRTIKYCSVYDNGASDASTVKRNSTSPQTPFGTLAPGGPCYIKNAKGAVTRDTVACLNGPHRGEACHGDNSACDSSPGAGDGLCDACPLEGGVTTEDEMFIALGFWYWPGH